MGNEQVVDIVKKFFTRLTVVACAHSCGRDLLIDDVNKFFVSAAGCERNRVSPLLCWGAAERRYGEATKIPQADVIIESACSVRFVTDHRTVFELN